MMQIDNMRQNLSKDVSNGCRKDSMTLKKSLLRLHDAKNNTEKYITYKTTG